MEQKKMNSEEIEKTILSIDGIKRAGMPPFFYTRLQAQMDKRIGKANSFWTTISKPAVSLGMLSLLIILNVAALTHYLRTSQQTTTQGNITGIQKFAEEYALSGSSVYTDKTTDK